MPNFVTQKQKSSHGCQAFASCITCWTSVASNKYWGEAILKMFHWRLTFRSFVGTRWRQNTASVCTRQICRCVCVWWVWVGMWEREISEHWTGVYFPQSTPACIVQSLWSSPTHWLNGYHGNTLNGTCVHTCRGVSFSFCPAARQIKERTQTSITRQV